MIKKTILKRLFAIVNIATLFLLFVSTSSLRGESTEEALGEIKIEGKYIQRLVLQDSKGQRKEFIKPEESIRLPEGEYSVQEIQLEGGFKCRGFPYIEGCKVTVKNNTPVVLKVGGPIKQNVRIQKKGSALVLNYELLGVGGEKYINDAERKPATFVIYKGDKQIQSGTFQYG